MISRPQVLFFAGVSVLGIVGAITVQAATEPLQMVNTSVQANNPVSSHPIPHTVQGKLTAFGPETASVICNQIKVNAEIWSNVTEGPSNIPIQEVELGSTTAEGSTLGSGCTYTLTFNYSPFQLPASSQYRISAETPTINGISSGYTDIVTPPFPEQFDMRF